MVSSLFVADGEIQTSDEKNTTAGVLGVGLGILLSNRVSPARYCCVTKPQLITTAAKEITGAHGERGSPQAFDCGRQNRLQVHEAK